MTHLQRFTRTIVALALAAVVGLHAQEPDTEPDAPGTPATPTDTTAEPAAETPPPDASANETADRYAAREKGIKALAAGITGPAARFFEEYRDAAGYEEPDFADATILLVKTHLLEGDVEAAAKALGRHSEHSTGLEDTYYRDALTYWRGAVLLEQGHPQRAVEAVETLAEQSTTLKYRSMALELLGDAYARMEEWQKAVAALTRLVNEFPTEENARRARFSLVKAWIAQGQLQQAEDMLQELRAAESPADPLRIALYRILIAVRQNHAERAYEVYQSVAEQRPAKADLEWWTAIDQLAAALTEQGSHEEAQVVLEDARLLAPGENERIQVRLRLIESMIRQENVSQAINAMEAFRKEHPDLPETRPVLLRLAELLRETGSYATATVYFAEIAEDEKAPQSLRYRAAFSRGWCLMEMEQYEDAVHAFAEAAKLGITAEQQAEALFLAADAAFRTENYTRAALYYHSVADNYPETPYAEKARYHQALSRAKAKLFSSAATVYKQFLEEFPESDLLPQARLERGIALKKAGDYAQAAKELEAFAETYTENDLAPKALLHAYQSAMGSDNVPLAVSLLTQIIETYPDSEPFPQALYQRAYVNFFQADYENAIADSTRFLEQFPRLPLATDVLMWMGDHYANSGELAQSEEYYLQLVSTHPESSDAPTALYEAAGSAYRRGDLLRASLLDRQLMRDYPEAPKRILAQAQLLQGDILAQDGRYQEAIENFSTARELSSDPAVTTAATGRLGDMYYSIGSREEGALQKALDAFQAILENPGAPPDVRKMARYRLAKTYEKMERADDAIKEYLDLVFQYGIETRKGRAPDWYYVARAGYDAARLLLLREDFHQAARIYERIAALNIPTAADALAKAREIREAHGLEE